MPGRHKKTRRLLITIRYAPGWRGGEAGLADLRRKTLPDQALAGPASPENRNIYALTKLTEKEGEDLRF